jgi:GNAT superfamily N-acetyltransferase
MIETREQRKIGTPRGEFVLRPERPEDEPFLSQLFAATNVDILHRAGIPAEMIDRLLAFQFRSQTATYRALFPNAIWSIVEMDGEMIGRYIENDEGDVVYFVDFALLPKMQARGLGPALTRALMQEWAARGRDTRVKVVSTNFPSLKMCRGLGFVETEGSDPAYVELRWRRPAS